MIKVYEKKEIPENCSTCLYCNGLGCAHADRRDDWFKYAFFGFGCPSYWTDQHRFTKVDE